MVQQYTTTSKKLFYMQYISALTSQSRLAVVDVPELCPFQFCSVPQLKKKAGESHRLTFIFSLRLTSTGIWKTRSCHIFGERHVVIGQEGLSL